MAYYPAICIMEIERVTRAVARRGERFLKRIFVREELDYCLPRAARDQHLACRLAAKLAVRSAMRAAGLRPASFGEIEIGRDGWGKPLAAVGGSAETKAKFTIMLSLSHSRRLAAASAVLGIDFQPL